MSEETAENAERTEGGACTECNMAADHGHHLWCSRHKAENAERGAELLPCHNPECGSDDVTFLTVGTLEDGDGYIGCAACGMSGPVADSEAEAGRLWNLIAIPSRPSHDTVSRAEILGALDWYAEKVAACRKVTSEGDAARQELDRDGGERARSAIADLPPATGEGEALCKALTEIAGIVAAPSSTSDHARLHAALDALDKVRAIARAALNHQGEKG